MRVIVNPLQNAEDNAMLQALYSRSPKSVIEHLEKLKDVGSGKFMEQYYLGYGHASVGDLGTTTVYFEGISMLAAKALEDTQLFNGQECSSRYIDFGSQPFVSEGRLDVRDLMDEMRQFYIEALPVTVEHLKRRYPMQDGESEGVYTKAINARAFDILRGYLPCGATTNVAWTGTLRNFKERLELLMHHPLSEVKRIAATAYACLYAQYPHSFSSKYANVYADGRDTSMYRDMLLEIEEEDLFDHLSSHDQFYSDILVNGMHDESVDIVTPPGVAITSTGLNYWYRDLAASYTAHPKGYRPPRHGGAEWSRLEVQGLLDFGSFRDLQRHRGGYCSMPVVDAFEGFHEWYFSNLPPQLYDYAQDLLDSVLDMDEALILEASDPTQQRILNQYFMPMGMLVPFSLSYSVSQAIYVSELRSGQTVHSTLRPVAQDMAAYLESLGGNTHWDARQDTWSLRRGTQDITERVAE